MNEFPQHALVDQVGESLLMSENVLIQFGISKVQEGDSTSDEEGEATQDDTSQRLDTLTTGVRKLHKTNKSLKQYIKSIAKAFAKKLKVTLLDCISSSSSSSSDGDGAKGKTQVEEDETEQDIDAYNGEEEEMGEEA